MRVFWAESFLTIHERASTVIHHPFCTGTICLHVDGLLSCIFHVVTSSSSHLPPHVVAFNISRENDGKREHWFQWDDDCFRSDAY